MASSPIARLATSSDLPTLSALVLHSFLRDPMIGHLYSPISADVSRGADTLWFWNRRFTKLLLNPEARIVVAEARREWCEKNEATEGLDQESVERARWMKEQGIEPEAGHQERQTRVLGFAVFKVKCGTGKEAGRETMGYWPWVRSMAIDQEISLRQTLFGRHDVDLVAMSGYLASEKQLQSQFHDHINDGKPSYYVDYLCTDFRFGRHGLGELVMSKGLKLSPNSEWPAVTEASSMGEGLYRRMGFKTEGQWKIVFSEGDETVLPVMVLRNY